MGSGLPELGLWRRLRPVPAAEGELATVAPPGTGPLILLHGGGGAAGLVAGAVLARRKDARLATLGPRGADDLHDLVQMQLQVPTDLGAARHLIAQCNPAAMVLFDTDLPRALLLAADEAGLPVTLIQTQPIQPAQRSWWRSPTSRTALGRVSRLLVPDRVTWAEALRLGIAPARIEVIGPLVPTRSVLRCNPREQAALQAQLHNRQVWLAAALPLDEAQAVFEAHLAVLTYKHGALLIAAPADPAAEPELALIAEQAGLTVARRAMDQEPTTEIQVLLAEDGAELGLWYRLASVSFLGGTLPPATGAGRPRLAMRHPFEPAALGSAIIRGPCTDAYPAEWQQLDSARAARIVQDADGLAAAASDLTAPDQTARLALAAWEVATSGAAVASHVAGVILSDIEGTTA
ncbi:glycosyltransferase N-terminal domain-containing protein [uncultured Paracoccus sp.]|uniref:3-deoxy-D-manno-octulosonic acid transferase n=1 Tax=uncultured Paracoccus sp. TaxID=189685 RepID=UPI002625205A|nr:glycosyltransferase N-terminal domain-containing protein [uncultured Paracoccus sp.]